MHATPLLPLLLLTWLHSLGSGVLWSGVPFVLRHDFDAGEVPVLTLSLVASALYAATALAAAGAVRRVRRRLGARGLLALVFTVQAAGGAMAWGGGIAGVVACTLITAMVGATLWPIVESYLTAGRDGDGMRAAIGRFNVTWMSAPAAALLLMAPLVEHGNSRLSLVGYGAVALASLPLLARLPRDPGSHRHGPAPATTDHGPPPESYRAFLHASRFLLPVSYLFLGALGPLLPFVMHDLALTKASETPLTATWMVARLLVVLAMARLAFWHGRWSTLGAALILLAAGFAVTVAAASVPTLALGLVALGVGQGIAYYAALYYAMRVGQASVDASSRFEALVGTGYIAGPAAALCAYGVAGQTAAGTTIAFVWVAAAVALAPAAWRLAHRAGGGGPGRRNAGR